MTVAQVAQALEDAKELPPRPDNLQLAAEPRNDIGNGQRLLARYGHDILDVAEAGWHIWADKRWELSIGQRGGPGPEVLRLAHDTARRIADEADAVEGSAPELPLIDDDSTEAKRTRAIWAALMDRASKHHKFGVASGNQGENRGHAEDGSA